MEPAYYYNMDRGSSNSDECALKNGYRFFPIYGQAESKCKIEHCKKTERSQTKKMTRDHG